MDDALISVSNLKKHFGFAQGIGRPKAVLKAVDGVSFALREGETLGLVGESGCGKSTTAKLLLRLEEPTEGKIVFAGEEVQARKGKTLRPFRRQVQAVFQDPYSALSPRMRVGEIIAEPLVSMSTRSRREIAERVQELCGLVGLSSQAPKLYPHEFSGGQRQRIVIARGLALEPRLLILDEPVSALDVSIRAQVLNLLQDLQDRLNLSYVLISHDLDVIVHMCDQVAVMYLGRIVERGTSEEIGKAPKHPYTQALFSAALPRHPAERHQRIKLEGEIPSPINPPAGCRFHTRCPYAMPICSEVDPDFRVFPGGQAVACHLIEPKDGVTLAPAVPGSSSQGGNALAMRR
jgi:oligopeptide/dipeptide ABC transporter ATP-binding protein